MPARDHDVPWPRGMAALNCGDLVLVHGPDGDDYFAIILDFITGDYGTDVEVMALDEHSGTIIVDIRSCERAVWTFHGPCSKT